MKNNYSAQQRLAHYSQLQPEDIFRELGISGNGLDEKQIESSRKQYGENRITSQKKDTTLYRLRRAFINFFSIVLLLLAVISFCTDVLLASNFSRNITTVAIILTMLLISGVVRFVQEMRSKRIADSLIRLVHTAVPVLRDGRWQELFAEQLVVGDIVRLDAGDRVPADIRLLQTSDFFVTQAVITGESGVLEKTAKILEFSPTKISDYTNTIFLGSSVTGGFCTGVVLAVGHDTLYGAVSLPAGRKKKGFSRGETSIAWVLIKFTAFLVPIVFVACGLTKGDWLESFLFALSVAVSLTPELLPMVINACLAKGSFQMGQKRTVVKNINAMQGFGSMDVLCVDKTGTLTGNTVLLEYYMDILGNENSRTLDLAFLNSFYHTGIFNNLDAAILKVRNMPKRETHFSKLIQQHKKLDEISFDYSRKFASVLVQSKESNILLVKGSVTEVVERSRYVEYQGTIQEAGPGSFNSVHAILDEILDDGMKVLAVAYKPMEKNVLQLEDEYDLTLLGYLAFFDTPKQSAASAIRKLQDLQINVKVLTGDNSRVAASICRRLDINTDHILTGSDLNTLSDSESLLAIEECSIFAELSPAQKAYIVETLQDNGHAVGFLGDGMNDFPAVAQADVGISVDTATDAVRDIADVILLKKDLNVLSDGVLEGRKAFANMSKYIKITASSNFGNICAIVIASVLLPFFPMTSLQLLLLTLLYDILCLILPWDNVDHEILKKPLEWSGRRLSKFMLVFGPPSSVFDILTFIFLYFVLCPNLCGGSFHILNSEMQARFITIFQTGWFLESMWTQVLILHMLRTKKLPFLQSKPSRPVVIVTLLGIFIFTTLIATPLGQSLGLTSLPPSYFIFLILTVIAYLLLVTLIKKLYVIRYHDLI